MQYESPIKIWGYDVITFEYIAARVQVCKLIVREAIKKKSHVSMDTFRTGGEGGLNPIL